MTMTRFEVRPEHLALIRRTEWNWDGVKHGAPAVDAGYPYGNDDVVQDIADIIDPDWSKRLGEDEVAMYDWLESQRTLFLNLHLETRIVLEIACRTGVFEVGVYEYDRYSSNWRKVAP